MDENPSAESRDERERERQMRIGATRLQAPDSPHTSQGFQDKPKDMHRAGPFSPGVTLENVEHVFRYQPAQEDQLAAMEMVRESLTAAAKTILRFVPPCADRTTAIRKLREARMDANAAISLRGQI